MLMFPRHLTSYFPTSPFASSLAAPRSPTYLESQDSEKVFGPVGEPPFRLGTELPKGAAGERRRHGTPAEVSLPENARGVISDEQGAKPGRVPGRLHRVMHRFEKGLVALPVDGEG